MRFEIYSFVQTNKLFMGSNGSGRFTDYTKSSSTPTNPKSGGTSGENKCDKAISANLEDIERCSYYTTHQDVPEVGTAVQLSFNQRLIVVTGGLTLGNLPTKFNYLMACLEDGYTYAGAVSSSSNNGIARIVVDLAPVKE